MRPATSPRIVDLVFGCGLPRGPWRGTAAVATAVVAHGALVAWAVTHSEPAATPVRTLEPEIELTAAPPPPPPPPPSPPAPAPIRTQAREHVAHARPRPVEPPPPPAQAGRIVAAAADPTAPVDLGDRGFVTGTGATYAGGMTSSSGTSTQPVEADPRPAPPPTDRPGPDRSQPVGLLDEDWRCPWPHEADDREIDEQMVLLRVVVRADGSAERVEVVRDPGFGFGPAAVACAQKTRFQPARDHQGAPSLSTAVLRLRFTR